MEYCFGCGEPTFSYVTVKLKKKLGKTCEHNLFHVTETTHSEIVSLKVPYCSRCKKVDERNNALLGGCTLLIIGIIYYLWHLFLPNFFEINGILKPLGVIIAYFTVVGALSFSCKKILRSITAHKRSPEDHPKVKEIEREGYSYSSSDYGLYL